MRQISTIAEFLEWRESLDSAKVGFVPTMGALHKGHQSLITKSVSENAHTIVSIFVNPTQFGANEDLSTYPRTLSADLELCKRSDVSVVFTPSIKEIYPYDEAIKILAPNSMSYVLEGASRPGHFDGVLQIVLKLFNLVRPNKAYFGKKDAQQLLLIKQMVRDLFLPIEVCACDIVRDDDGLALSSRNIYLTSSQRQLALAIPKSLFAIKRAFDDSEMSFDKLAQIALEILKDIEVEYLCACDYNLKRIDTIIQNQSLILLTAKIGKTRLLDNLWL